MFKKGEVTTFIIIGILVLAAFALVLYLRQAQIAQIPAEEVVPEDVKPIQLFVDECIQKTAVPGIYLLGEQGGYITPPENSFITTRYTIGYGFSSNKTTLPSIEEMQQQISEYLQQMLPVCTAKFETFTNEGMQINEGNISVETRIFQDDILLSINYPISILKNEKENKLQNFVTRVPVRLGRDYNAASQIIRENQDGFAITDIIFPDMDVSLLPAAADTLVVSILDEKSVIENDSFVFMFAYELSTNRKPVLDEIPNPVFMSGEEMYLQVNATDTDGDKIIYSTNSTEFKMNPDSGEITGTAPAVGNYDVKIIAEDGNGGRDEANVIFWII
jgi:hypothetical protein